MKFRILLAVVAVIGVACAGYFYVLPLRRAAEAPPELVASTYRGMVVRGRLEPVTGVIHLGAFTEAGNVTIGRMFVEAGDTVREGQVLAELGNTPALQARVIASEAEVELARRKLAQTRQPYRAGAAAALQAAIETRRIDVTVAQDQVTRSHGLADGFRAKADKVRDAGTLARAQAELAQAEANMKALTDVSPTEVAVAEAEVARAEANLAASKAAAELSLLRAPLAGEIIKVDLRPGEPLAGGAVLQLADMAHVKIVAEVDERLIDRVRVGDLAKVKVRGGISTIGAQVTKIGRLVISTHRMPLDAATGRGGRFIEVELAPKGREGLPRVAGLELSVAFDAATSAE
jgi:HlyD family secretion protein